jgi:hypothetical protein
MGAYKELVIDIADTMYQISRDLNEASESGDFDEMKQSRTTSRMFRMLRNQNGVEINGRLQRVGN